MKCSASSFKRPENALLQLGTPGAVPARSDFQFKLAEAVLGAPSAKCSISENAAMPQTENLKPEARNLKLRK
jgi:hypothetical protein